MATERPYKTKMPGSISHVIFYRQLSKNRGSESEMTITEINTHTHTHMELDITARREKKVVNFLPDSVDCYIASKHPHFRLKTYFYFRNVCSILWVPSNFTINPYGS
jgi:hypothetical protein